MNSMLLSFGIMELVTLFRGWRRGLYGVIYGVVTWVVIAIGIYFIAPQITPSLTANKSLHDKIYEAIEPYANVLAMSDFGGDDAGLDMDTGLLENYIQNFIGSEEQLEQYEKIVLGEAEADTGSGTGSGGSSFNGGSTAAFPGTEEAKRELCEEYTKYVMLAIAMCIVYIMLKIVTVIAGFFIKGFMIKHEKSGVDSLGILWGLAEGILYMFVAMTMVSLIAPTSIGGMMMKWITQDPILRYLYDVNIFKNLFTL